MRRAAWIRSSVAASSSLQVEEVLVGLQVGIGLGHREKLLQAVDQEVLGRGLLVGRPVAATARFRASMTASSVARSWAA